MSMCYWICEGIGVRCDDVYKYLNMSKCLSEIKKLFPDESILGEYTPENFDCSEFDELMYGDFFQCVGDFLSRLDENEVLSYGDDGDGNSFCYYTPTYPWCIGENDPTSLLEARELVKNVVRKVCDIDEETLDKLIDNDIYEYGCG